MKEKPKAVIFGASKGGQNFLKHQDTYKIICAIDNDEKKHNSQIEEYPIFPPEELYNIDFEYIIITSMFSAAIKDQLLNQLAIEEEKIIIAPKSQLKVTYEPFSDPETMKYAKEKLMKFIQLLEKKGIFYFVDFGTLLGIVREKDLIEWDDDIDLSILSSDFDLLKRFLEEELYLFNDDVGVQWSSYVMYSDDGEPISASLTFQNDLDLNKFQINIGIISFDNGLAIQTFNQVSEHHFLTREFVPFEGESIAVPNDYETYLTITYGDWKIPKKGLTFDDYSIIQNNISNKKKVFIKNIED